jgi:citrate lyase beta subunit
MIESFGAVTSLGEMLRALPVAIHGVGLGFEDMLTELPHPASGLKPLLQQVRAQVAIQCRARGLWGIDGISGADETEEAFAEACEHGKSSGLHAKFSIHPRQVDPINRIFGPAPNTVRWAERVAELTGLRDDFGYQRVEELLITPPKIKKARHILACRAS